MAPGVDDRNHHRGSWVTELRTCASKAISNRTVTVAFLVVIIAVVSALGAYSLTRSASSTSTAVCTQPSGVTRVQLTASPTFGEVTTFALPEPLKAPNSVTAAADGSVWFGEVALRGVAHLFTNGTLMEYAWPSSVIGPDTSCFDLSELWGVVIWYGMVWGSDSPNDQLVGLSPSNDSFQMIHLASGSLPRFLAIDTSGDLWFTESSTSATQIGELTSPTSAPRYFDIPAGPGEISASVIFYNSSLAYVVTVNPATTAGAVFSFDPSAAQPVFTDLSSKTDLFAPYSAAVADGGLWVGEHDASEVAFLNETTGTWSFFPTSLNPEVLETLPYYLIANGTSVWFNEHDGDRVADIQAGSTLTEYNISSVSLTSVGIGNALTIALDRNLVWFTEWTGNEVGYVNASMPPDFSISAVGPRLVTLSPGSSSNISLAVSGSTDHQLTFQYADSESNDAHPANLTFSSNVTTIDSLSGSKMVSLQISAKSGMAPGQYLALATVTDGLTSRSVYIVVDVT
jgi:streptogramin lyase